MHDAMISLITYYGYPLIDPAHPASKAHAAKRLIELLHRNSHEHTHDGEIYDDLRGVFRAIYAWMTFVEPEVPLAQAASWPQPEQ